MNLFDTPCKLECLKNTTFCRPPETTPECYQIWGHRRWCSFCEGIPVLLQSDRLLWRLTCVQAACTWSLERQDIFSDLSNIEQVLKSTSNGKSEGADHCVLLPLCFSSNTVLRLPKGANCRAKQSGWMLMPTSETMQGCWRECNVLDSWRNSAKLR